MASKQVRLEDILSPVVESMGFDCWGVEYLHQGRHSVLRVYIDSEAGITLDNCESVSRQISGVLDVEDPIPSEYTLEVSSPGMDRPLFKLSQFKKFVGSTISVKLKMPFDGKRKYRGVLNGVEQGEVLLLVERHELLLPYEMIDKANVVA
ncbi:MAG: ribosome maturation factor RimP [Gammaproteobacteria bacterium]|nr:MAG: ribosome maturation factor RimP [Gammaproteobacteria bacterium]